MRHFSLKNPLVFGTIILTLTGFASRFIGFFYRIFLSRTFGAEGMGIYQLTAPVLALTFALTAAGIQTSISRFVARETSTRDYRYSFVYLFSGLVLSLTLSILCAGFVYCFSKQIAWGRENCSSSSDYRSFHSHGCHPLLYQRLFLWD